MTSDDQRDFSAAGPNELAAALVEGGLDIPPGLIEAILGRGEAMVEPLSRLLLNPSYWDTSGARDPYVWAPVHALHLLGALGSVKAIPPVLTLLRYDPGSDLLTDSVPAVLGCYGGAAVEALVELIRDRSIEAVLRACIAMEALLEIGQRKPEFRPKIVREILELLDSKSESKLFKSWLVLTAATVDESRIEQAIRTCFETGQISLEILHFGVVRQLRASRTADTPWAGLEKGQDPREHFRPENLVALARWWTNRSDLSESQRRLWRSASVLDAALETEAARRRSKQRADDENEPRSNTPRAAREPARFAAKSRRARRSGRVRRTIATRAERIRQWGRRRVDKPNKPKRGH